MAPPFLRILTQVLERDLEVTSLHSLSALLICRPSLSLTLSVMVGWLVTLAFYVFLRQVSHGLAVGLLPYLVCLCVFNRGKIHIT